MTLLASKTRHRTLLWTLSALLLATSAWSQDSGRKKKNKDGSQAVTKALKKVDRQLLSYSPEKARQDLESVMDEKDPRVDAAMGQILILEQEYDEGVSKLKAAARKSEDLLILLALGDGEMAARKRGPANSTFEDVRAKAEAALQEDSKDAAARFALGVAQSRLGDYDGAVTNLTQAKAKDASDPRIPFELGMAKMSQNDNQAAFDQFTAAIDLYSGYAYAYYYRALAANKIGRKDITVNDLDRFLALAPDAPEAAKAERILQAARG
jgi:tetratricopeptide (TPR) repeat protein